LGGSIGILLENVAKGTDGFRGKEGKVGEGRKVEGDF